MASRICPQCGHEAPRMAKFCSECSSSLVGEPTIPREPQIITQQKQQAAASQSKTIVISILAVAVLVLLVIAGYAYSKYTSVVNAETSKISAPPVVQAVTPPSVPAPPVTQAPTTAAIAPPITQAPQASAPTVPADIVSYLAFVQQMEQQRSNLENAQVGAILPLLATAQSLKTDDDEDKSNGTNQINQAMTDNLGKWQNLIKEFQAQNPPDGCADLANSYYKFLEDYTDLSSQIQVALENGDTAKVMSLQTAQTQVDQDANAADAALSAVCTQYGAKKLFSISTGDTGSGASLLGG